MIKFEKGLQIVEILGITFAYMIIFIPFIVLVGTVIWFDTVSDALERVTK